jgi:hypothetical protein
MTKKKQDYPLYFGYWEGYRFVQVRSIGYKWVWLRNGPFSNPKYLRKFKKIRRSEWDKGKFITESEYRWKADYTKFAMQNDLLYATSKKHKWGWRRRTDEELEAIYIDFLEKKTKEVA